MPEELTTVLPVIPEGAKTDETPVLAEDTVVGVPEFYSFDQLLPSQRMRLLTKCVKISKLIPEGWGGKEEVDFSSLADEDLDSLTIMLEQAEEVVLAQAKDKEEMKTWLLAQEEPMGALMQVFQHVMETLGNS